MPRPTNIVTKARRQSRNDVLRMPITKDADIVAARRAGIASLLVLTGVADAASASALEGEQRPDRVTASAADLPDLLGIG